MEDPAQLDCSVCRRKTTVYEIAKRLQSFSRIGVSNVHVKVMWGIIRIARCPGPEVVHIMPLRIVVVRADRVRAASRTDDVRPCSYRHEELSLPYFQRPIVVGKEFGETTISRSLHEKVDKLLPDVRL